MLASRTSFQSRRGVRPFANRKAQCPSPSEHPLVLQHTPDVDLRAPALLQHRREHAGERSKSVAPRGGRLENEFLLDRNGLRYVCHPKVSAVIDMANFMTDLSSLAQPFVQRDAFTILLRSMDITSRYRVDDGNEVRELQRRGLCSTRTGK